MSRPVHISSLLLRTNPAQKAALLPLIAAIPEAEVALDDPSGKIIVTLETSDEGAIVDAMHTIERMPGVVSAALVYHQADAMTDLQEEETRLKAQ